MNRRPLATGTAGVLLLAALAPGTAQAAPRPHQPTQRWIVRYADQQSATAGTLQMASQGRHAMRRLDQVFPGAVVTLDAGQATALRRLRGVLSVEPDARMQAAQVQANPPAGLDRIDQRTNRPTRTYSSHYTGAGVTVYVVDSGLNLASRDFAGRITAGPNLVDGGGAPVDCAGHGTHVAGIAAGTRYGVAKKATVVPVKVLDCDGSGYTSDTVSALNWIIGRHAAGTPAVINMSITGPASAAIDAAVNKALADGITVVTAAGNHEAGESSDACRLSPSRVPGALTVADATLDDRVAPTSNLGRCVKLFAPGTQILSDYIGSPTATASMTGTSMAAPAVAGAAALVLQARRTWTPAQVRSEILGKATRNRVLRTPAGTPNLLLYTLGGVTPGDLEKVGRPTVVGTARVGSTLTARPGSWGNGSVTLRCAWFRVSSTGVRTAVTGATTASHRVTAQDKGRRLVVRVTGSSLDHLPTSTFSPVTAVVS